MNFKLLQCVALIAFAGLTANAFKTDTISVNAKGYLPTDMNVTVITPDTPRSDAGYNTVYLLNGFGGDNKSWSIIRPDLGEWADMYGVVFVLPSGMDTWYWDSPVNPEVRMESFFTDVLVPYIDKNYPTNPHAANRAITGLSMGGHGGLWLGLRHPDIWKNCGSTSGGVDIRPFPERWKMKDALGEESKNPDIWNVYTVINLVPTLQPGASNIIFDCGTDDFFAGVNDNLHKAFLDAKIPHDYISRPGNHTNEYWRNALPYQLWFFQTHFNSQD